MKSNDIIQSGSAIYRIIDIADTKAFVVDCKKKSMPKWLDMSSLQGYTFCSLDTGELQDINEMGMQSRKTAYERFSVVSNILPFITDKNKRSAMISRIADDKGISRQTVCTYLWQYLVYQNISILAPKPKEKDKELSLDEKNIKWALNKYFYTQHKNTLTTTYTLMLKEKYCDSAGTLMEQYPSFYQFRYFYRKHRKMENYLISRNGLKNYQRNNRPLLGDGIQDFAHSIGFGMLDATVCDIYLVCPIDDYKLWVRFNTGEAKIYDFKPLLSVPAFAPLADDKLFREVCINDGVTVWANGDIDIAPEELYQNGIVTQDFF